ncbi:MAG: SDR family oxidoreductase [Burkholderiales bacterium]|nr:SDR family oxidoreductase [Burkholderiales bacterium]
MRVFITGASSGLGAALARHYAAAGATLGLTGRNEARLAEVQQSLAVPGERYLADVCDGEAMRAAAEHFMTRHGVPDLVIANAGISIGVDTADPDDLPVLEQVLRTNVLGLATTFQPFIEPMRRRGRGTLAGIASVAGIRGLPGSAAYSGAKAAAIAWLESLRVELRPQGVHVVTVCPGFIDTPMTRVNRYRMPFLLSADEAARRIARVIAGRRRYAIVPWQMAVVGRVMRLMPAPLYDLVFRRMPRKPRKLPA